MTTKAKKYIAYQGDRPLGTGTIKELTKSLGIPYISLESNTLPSTHNRSKDGDKAILLYEIEKDDEEK